MANKEEKWVSVFLEVALRALRRVHYEYGIWGAGRQWKSGPDRPGVINMGHGLELADERAVCAAIVQEFMTSPSLTGLWQENGRNQLRFFSVLREQPYRASTDPKHPEMVDLIVEKYEFKDEELGVYKPRLSSKQNERDSGRLIWRTVRHALDNVHRRKLFAATLTSFNASGRRGRDWKRFTFTHWFGVCMRKLRVESHLNLQTIQMTSLRR